MEYKRNRWTFGLGTVGRDMAYTMVSMYLMFYLTDVLNVPAATMGWITLILACYRVFDACNDPFMGLIVDNTRTRWGKFKPYIAVGAAITGVFTILMFTDFGLTGTAFLVVFVLIYLLWELSFTINDIAYWSMLPSLSVHQTEREKIGAIARICANVGLFFVVVSITELTKQFGLWAGSLQKGYFIFTVMVVAVMWLGQLVTLFGVKEPGIVVEEQEKTYLRELAGVILKNDQLLITAVAMALFMIGYTTTAAFGQYFFKYAYGDESMYGVFGAILGIAQISALIVFPFFSKRFNRKTLYSGAIALVCAGYIVFFFAPTNTMLFIGIAGLLLFVGQAFIQLLMLMFLADSVDYGHWKLGKRNDSITFAIQPFVNKIGSAAATAVVGGVVIASGIHDAEMPTDVTAGGIQMMKLAMLIFPLVCIVASYLLYRWKYKIDKAAHERILTELGARGELNLKG